MVVLNEVTSHWLFATFAEILSVELCYIEEESAKGAFSFLLIFDIENVCVYAHFYLKEFPSRPPSFEGFFFARDPSKKWVFR